MRQDKRFVSFVLMVLLLSGCASKETPPPVPLTPCEEAERLRRADVDTAGVVGEGAGAGAVLGGILGAAWAVLTGGDRNKIIKSAAAGAGGGAALGAGYGLKVAGDKKQFKEELQFVLDKRCEIYVKIVELERINDELEDTIASLRDSYAVLRSKQYASRDTALRDLQAKQTRIKEDIRAFEKLSVATQRSIDEHRTAASAQNNPQVSQVLYNDPVPSYLATARARKERLSEEAKLIGNL